MLNVWVILIWAVAYALLMWAFGLLPLGSQLLSAFALLISVVAVLGALILMELRSLSEALLRQYPGDLYARNQEDDHYQGQHGFDERR